MADNETENIDLAKKESLSIKKEMPANMASSKMQIKKDGHYRERDKDITMNNGVASVTVKKTGAIDLSSMHNAHIQLDPGGAISMSSNRSSEKTDEYRLDAYDVIINNHKLNNKLYELADFKKILNGYDSTTHVAGGLTMLGTVLVRAWEPNLQRYVMVRRQINIPMFSPSIGSREALEGLHVNSEPKKIHDLLSGLDLSNMTSYAQLANQLQEQRKQAILAQEAATAEKNAKIKEENKNKQATSMTTLTGQDPTRFGSVSGGTVGGSSGSYNISPSAVSTAIKGDEQKQQEDTDNRTGWDEANGRPVSTTAIWYKVKCSSHAFYVMQGHTVLKTYPCNTSNKGTTTNKVDGDNKTLLGVFQINSVEKNNMEQDKRPSGCKLPNQAGTFGTYWMALSCGFGIGIHGDYPSEDAKKILTKDAPADREPRPGEGSTHGCIRLYNADVAEVATKYAKMKTGQYIKIEA